MEINREVKAYSLKNLFNEIVKEVNRVLGIKADLKNDNLKIKEIKLVGTTEEILKGFLKSLEEFLKEGKAVVNAKVIKIKRLWQEKLSENMELAITLQLLLKDVEKKEVRIKFNESKKQNKEFIINFSILL